MSRIASPSLRRRSARRSRSCAWIVTSSAVVGSSAISSAGLHASAIAMQTRCFMPPESSCGHASARRAGSAIPTRSSSPIASRRAVLRSAPRWSRSTSPICAPTG
jgi:hypothetical protein